jgi:hypothetical protein
MRFKARLDAGKLTIRFTAHFPTVEAARERADPFVRRWAIVDGLQRGREEIRFDYVRGSAKVIDRRPPPPGAGIEVATTAAISSWSAMDATVSLERGTYPMPPAAFDLSPNVDSMWAVP